MSRTERKLIFILLILAGLVVGGLIGEIAKGIPSLGWLTYEREFALPKELVVNLIVMVINFGFIIKISIANIIGIIIGLIIGKILKY